MKQMFIDSDTNEENTSGGYKKVEFLKSLF